MIKAFDQMRLMVTKYMDPAIAGRDYDTASNMMVNGDALFFIMGDWELGAHQVGRPRARRRHPLRPVADRLRASPASSSTRTRSCSSSRTTPTIVEGQKLLARLILSPEFQTVFNITKGSIPARLDVDLIARLQRLPAACRRPSCKASIEAGTLVRSMAHNMTVLQKYRGAMMDTITEFVNTPEMTSEEAANLMADAVEAQM